MLFDTTVFVMTLLRLEKIRREKKEKSRLLKILFRDGAPISSVAKDMDMILISIHRHRFLYYHAVYIHILADMVLSLRY